MFSFNLLNLHIWFWEGLTIDIGEVTSISFNGSLFYINIDMGNRCYPDFDWDFLYIKGIYNFLSYKKDYAL